MHHHPSSRRRRLALSIGIVTALTLVSSCGSDDDDSAATTVAPTLATTAAPETTAATETTAADTTAAPDTTDTMDTTDATDTTATDSTDTTDDTGTTAGSTGDVAYDSTAFCSAEVDLEIIGANLGDPEADPVEGASALLPSAEIAADLAPAELADAFDAVLSTLQNVIDTGDGSQLESIDLDAIHDYGTSNCGWTTVPVEMTSYHFGGIPATLPAGDYDFEATNASPDPHVMLIVKRKDGVTASWEELLASPEGQGQVDTAAATFAVTGDTGTAITRLEPGEYLVLCPISEGTTLEAEGTGPPHFVLGMQQIVTVTE